MKQFTYHQPKDIKEAGKVFKADKKALPLAGGTDLLGLMKDGIVEPENVVNLKAMSGMKGIKYKAGKGLSIGALTPLVEIAEHPVINKKFTALAQAALAVASPQLRNVGTLGGNICQRPRCWYFRGDFDCIRKGGDTCFAVEGENKFHCVIGGGPCFIVHPSDTAVALMALDARLTVAFGKTQRTIKMKDFFVLPDKDASRENVLNPGDVITDIFVPELPVGATSKFLKYTERDVWDFATVSGAIVKPGKLVLGGVAPIPWLEKDPANILKDAEPMTQNKYKIQLAKNLVKELLA